MSGAPTPSKGVAITNWMVSKAAGLLERKTSRRGFLIGSAMAGSAVAVAGCMPVTTPGSAYQHITDCAGGLCTDGYTEFCCTINDGLNTCPSGSFAGGWWRADFSSFCNGTRYYIDCMQNCCGQDLGNGFCAGCVECTCGGGCDSRRIYCNYFRYGQCHQEIGITGPIACRVVTCTPPYNDAALACTTAAAVDNSTAEHTSPCITTPPPATVLASMGTSAATQPGNISVFGRFGDSWIRTRAWDGVAWGDWNTVAPPVTSGITSAQDPTGLYVIGRGVDLQIRYNRLLNGAWTGEGILSGVAPTSDPKAVGDSTGVYVFVRDANRAVSAGRFVAGSWTGWGTLGGTITSNPGAVASQWGVFVFGRGADNALYYRQWDGTAWSAWSSLGATVTSDPTAVADATTVYVFVRQPDNHIWCRRWSGGSWLAWEDLGGYVVSDPFAVAGPDGMYLFVRAIDGSIWLSRQVNAAWSGFVPLGGAFDADVTAVGDGSGVYVFARAHDSGIWTGRYAAGAWSGWSLLGGSVFPMTAIS